MIVVKVIQGILLVISLLIATYESRQENYPRATFHLVWALFFYVAIFF